MLGGNVAQHGQHPRAAASDIVSEHLPTRKRIAVDNAAAAVHHEPLNVVVLDRDTQKFILAGPGVIPKDRTALGFRPDICVAQRGDPRIHAALVVHLEALVDLAAVPVPLTGIVQGFPSVGTRVECIEDIPVQRGQSDVDQAVGGIESYARGRYPLFTEVFVLDPVLTRLPLREMRPLLHADFAFPEPMGGNPLNPHGNPLQ